MIDSQQLDQTCASLRELSYEDAVHFLRRGFVVVESAFAKEIAEAVCDNAWEEMRRKQGIDRNDQSTWLGSIQGPHSAPGYFRTSGEGLKIHLPTEAPRAFQAIVDIVGGAERLHDGGSHLAWNGATIANLGQGTPAHEGIPNYRLPGWHKDGWHFRHFLDSPEQGLLIVPIYSDILPQSGGTMIATDSIVPVAEMLISNPGGIHPDGVQGGGYLIPGLIEQCSHFDELVGKAGDVVLVHPYMLHRVTHNPSTRERFIANAALVLTEPMCFDRHDGTAYSLVELAVLNALDEASVPFAAENEREILNPFPFRDKEQAAIQRERLIEEMDRMAQGGIVTPAWAVESGYMSNGEVPYRTRF